MIPVEPWKPIILPLRSAAIYSAVIDSLQVETSPRYQSKGGKTFCNIFVWDVTRAIGCEVPHWVCDDEAPSGAREQTANDMVDWLSSDNGSRSGWMYCSGPIFAQTAANDGSPVIAAWKSLGGPGHIAMVVPGTAHPDMGPRIAQAGKTTSSNLHLTDGFGARPVEFFWHP